jgi:hypothetical protein
MSGRKKDNTHVLRVRHRYAYNYNLYIRRGDKRALAESERYTACCIVFVATKHVNTMYQFFMMRWVCTGMTWQVALSMLSVIDWNGIELCAISCI